MFHLFNIGDFIKHPEKPDWGIGQVQSIIGARITVNFEHNGKTVINADHVHLNLVANRTAKAKNK